MPDGQGLAGSPQDDLLVGHGAPHAQRMDADVRRTYPTPGPGHRLPGGRIGCPVRGGGRHAFGGGRRSARRGVDLAVVMDLHDLGRLEPRRCHLGEAHHENGTDGEVGSHQAVAGREGSPKVVQVVVTQATGADDDVYAGRGQDRQVGPAGLGHREVHDHVDTGVEQVPYVGHQGHSGDLRPGSRRVGCGGQDHPLGGRDRSGHHTAHAAGSPKHTDTDRISGHGVRLAVTVAAARLGSGGRSHQGHDRLGRQHLVQHGVDIVQSDGPQGVDVLV